MTRRHSLPIALVVLLATLLAACGGGTTGPVLTDPTEIITAALKSSEAAKSVHVDLTVDGVVPVTLPGSTTSTPVDLTGTTASVEADLANSESRVTFAIPAVLGLAGELIQADGTTYLKSTLTGPKFKVIDGGASLPIDPTDTSGMIDNLGDFLLKPGVDPVKGDDVSCGGGTCYTIVVDLDATELAALVGDAATSMPVDIAGATLKMTLKVGQATPNHLAGVSIEIGLPGGKTVVAELTFSKWDEAVTITAPSADEVDAG
jgi:hypothetical protein